MSYEPEQAASTGYLNFNLPGGKTLAVEDLDVPLTALMAIARTILKDDKITPENLCVDKHFFFVNRSTGTMIDDQMLRLLALRTLQLQFGQELEMCLV